MAALAVVADQNLMQYLRSNQHFLAEGQAAKGENFISGQHFVFSSV